MTSNAKLAGFKTHLLTFLIAIAGTVGAVWVLRMFDKPQKDNERFLAIENQVASIVSTAGRLETAADRFEEVASRFGVVENDLTHAKSDIERIQFALSNQSTRIEVQNAQLLAQMASIQRSVGWIEGFLKAPAGQAMLHPTQEWMQ